MGGIIQAFLGGASKGMADAGKMLLTSQLNEERDEARFLRDKTLRQQIAADDREFRASERVAGEETAASVAETKVGTDADAAEKKEAAALERSKLSAKSKGKDGSTTNMKDAQALRAAGYPPAMADAVAHGALKQIKDEDTGDMVLVNALDNKPVGRLTTIDGRKQWLPEGQEKPNAKVTKAHRKESKKAGEEKAGWLSSDEEDFPSTGGDRKTWEKQEAQRRANEDRAASKSTGIVGSQAEKPEPQAKPAPKTQTATGETKLVGAKKRKMTKEQFMKAMTAKHGADKMDQILNMWEKL